MSKNTSITYVLGIVLLLSACSAEEVKEETKASTQVITNRLHVPPEVVSNLGITFGTAKRAAIGDWKEIVGTLEIPEEKRYFVHSPASARLISLTPLWNTVKKGDKVVELVSAELLSKQHALVTAANVYESAKLDFERTGDDAKANLRLAQTERTFRQELHDFSVLTGFSPEQLLQKGSNGSVLWRGISSLVIPSPGDGQIVELTATVGEVLEKGSKIATIFDLSELLFRGRVPESSLAQIKPGARIRIQAIGSEEYIESELTQILPVIDENSKSVVVEAAIDNSARKFPHGLSAIAQLLIKGGENQETVISSDCIVQDGLEMVIFKRDEADPAYVVRTTIELGGSSGRMVEVISGVMEGDEVVCNGIHQLKLTGLGRAPSGGHFHADGTWHEGDK